MRYLIPLTLLTAVASFVGCSQQQIADVSGEEAAVAAITTVNENCPIMSGEVTAEGGTVEWNGQTVGFCCPECVEKFEALSDDEKATALAKAGEGHGDHDHGDHDHGDHDHGDDEGEAAKAS